MKRSTHFYAFTFALLLISTLAHATSSETINGLKFLIDTEKNEATLVADSLNYSGDIIVPEKITSGSKDYPVTSLGDYCFAYCTGLTSITIPSSVTSLGDRCFGTCIGLTSVTIPSSITSLGEECFFTCKNLTSVSCYATTPPICQNVFSGFDFALCKLYVPQESIDKYKATDGWNSFSNIYAIDGSGESNNINSTSTRSIVATCNNGIITISGLNAQENVTFYTVNGEQLGTAATVDGVATYAVNVANDIVIAKFGGSSIKIAMK